jgi:hypothetical protein
MTVALSALAVAHGDHVHDVPGNGRAALLRQEDDADGRPHHRQNEQAEENTLHREILGGGL